MLRAFNVGRLVANDDSTRTKLISGLEELWSEYQGRYRTVCFNHPADYPLYALFEGVGFKTAPLFEDNESGQRIQTGIKLLRWFGYDEIKDKVFDLIEQIGGGKC